jgi:hypothetical protein
MGGNSGSGSDLGRDVLAAQRVAISISGDEGETQSPVP